MRVNRFSKLAVIAAVAALVTTLAATPASASDNQFLSASRTGVSGSLTVDWTGARSFVLKGAKLSDTACDSQPVYFRVVSSEYGLWPKHWNTSGCGTTVTFPDLPGSLASIDISNLWLEVCRDTWSPECKTSAVSDNPYF
jgi:hypothetical protein